MVITRNDIPEYPEYSLQYHTPWHPHLSTDHSYLYSFPNHSLPSTFYVALQGLDSGHSLVIGFCVPLGASADEVTFRGSPAPVKIGSYEDLLKDRTGAGYFWDEQVIYCLLACLLLSIVMTFIISCHDIYYLLS